MLTKLSVAIRAGLHIRGETQAKLAEGIDVSENTISNWMQGRNFPDRESLFELKSHFSWSEEKIATIVEDWYENRHANRRYRVAGHDYVSEKYDHDYKAFLRDLIRIDLGSIGGLSTEYNGTPEQWAPIYETCPSTWRILIRDDEIVGYWHFVCLTPNYFDLIISGAIVDAQISIDMIEYPVIPNHYRAYFSIITTTRSEQNPTSFNTLFSSLQSVISKFTEEGIFMSDIGATAFSYQGKKLCKLMGMQFLHRHPKAPPNEVADVYHMTGLQMSRGYLGRNKKLASAYSAEFGS